MGRKKKDPSKRQQIVCATEALHQQVATKRQLVHHSRIKSAITKELMGKVGIFQKSSTGSICVDCIRIISPQEASRLTYVPHSTAFEPTIDTHQIVGTSMDDEHMDLDTTTEHEAQAAQVEILEQGVNVVHLPTVHRSLNKDTINMDMSTESETPPPNVSIHQNIPMDKEKMDVMMPTAHETQAVQLKTSEEGVIVLSLHNMRRDLEKLSPDIRALIAFELAASEKGNIRSDALNLTRGDSRDIDSLSRICNSDYLLSRNKVLVHFISGLSTVEGTGGEESAATVPNKLPVKEKNIYKIAKAIESCMGLTTPITVLPFHFRELVLLYSFTRSRTAVTIMSSTAPYGCYTTVRKWLDKLAKAESGAKLPSDKGDTLCVFDNNQILQRRWGICVDNVAGCSVITMVIFMNIDSEGTLQFREDLKPCNWMWSNLTPAKLATLREGHRNAAHQETRYLKHFHPWLSSIIQQVAEEQTVTAGKCEDDVDRQVSINKHEKRYKTCPHCGNKEVPKTKRKCTSCDEWIKSSEIEKNKQANERSKPATNQDDVRVTVEKQNDATYGIKYEQSSCKSTEYDHLPQHHPKKPPEVKIGEPIFVNPCSYVAVAEVFREIGRQAGIAKYGGKREWLCIVCDGLPYVLGYQIIERTFECRLCGTSVNGLAERKTHRKEHDSPCTFGLEFDWVLLQPGPGHIEMNMLKSFVKFVWPVFWEGMVEVFNFKSENAKRSAHNVSDHHKGMALAKIARDSFAKELVLPYVRQEILKENSQLSVAGYLNFALNTVTSPNYALMFELTFSILDAIFLYRAGLRSGDTSMMDAGRAMFSRMWCARMHPMYRQLALYDTIGTACMPTELQNFMKQTKSINLKGTPYTGEGADFKLEEVNKSVQHWVPSVPRNKDWYNACANQPTLSKLRQSTLKEMDIKDPRERSSRTIPDLQPEVLAFRTALREKKFLDNYNKKSPLTSFGKEPLDEDLVNFGKKAAEKELIYLESFLQHHEEGGFKRKKPVTFKEPPIFVTPQERMEYYNIHNMSINDCVPLIISKIAEVQDEGMRRNFSKSFQLEILSKGKKVGKQKYIDFYELIEEHQSTVMVSSNEEEAEEDEANETVTPVKLIE